MPKKITGYYALIRRLHPRHEKSSRIIEDYKNRKAGFGGEKHFDKQMLEFRPPYPHAILHDVCLKHDGIYFQMDSILITPESINIFEVKNIAGKIIVTADPTQFIKVLPSGERKVIKNPIIELDRKKFHLTNWLKQRNIDMPIIGMVVFAYYNELSVEVIPETEIMFAYEVPSYLRKLVIKNKNLDKHKIRKLAIELKNNHLEYNPFPMIKNLDIAQIDILSGVICNVCGHYNMLWVKKKWNCPRCGHTETRWQTDILSDWLCLIDNKISNQQFRSFALLPNQQVAKRLLNHPNLSPKGKGRGSYYVMNPKIIIENETLHDI
ncbi:nuclease-related domain-containing protein [Sporosarcina limicola]|uniref:NERD domain-containing protein n=1 Tax=Sporosarcina limicola TaxID=34101 RepID=A0A927MM67_9BACL|nr:nuclease-related domain-containing protein [Sporosarcina limicola]MBE1555667.1 hypothetical protein [Sporosarcina limicola]